MSRPNLTPLTLVSVLTCVLGGKSGLTRKATWALRPIAWATWPSAVQLRGAFHVEEQHVALQAVVHLRIGLADAGKDDLAAGAAREQGPVQLAAARDVETRPGLGHQPADRQVGIGLEAETEKRLDRLKGPLQLAQMVQQCFLAVNVERSAILLRQSRHRRLVAIENTIAVLKMIHGLRCIRLANGLRN